MHYSFLWIDKLWRWVTVILLDLQELTNSGHHSLAQSAQGHQHRLASTRAHTTQTSFKRVVGTIDKDYRIIYAHLMKQGTLKGLPEHLPKSCWAEGEWGVQYDPLFPNTELGCPPQLMLQPGNYRWIREGSTGANKSIFCVHSYLLSITAARLH